MGAHKLSRGKICILEKSEKSFAFCKACATSCSQLGCTLKMHFWRRPIYKMIYTKTSFHYSCHLKSWTFRVLAITLTGFSKSADILGYMAWYRHKVEQLQKDPPIVTFPQTKPGLACQAKCRELVLSWHGSVSQSPGLYPINTCFRGWFLTLWPPDM